MESTKLTSIDKDLYRELLNRNMAEDTITSSLQEMTELLEIHYGQKVIVLIDEYDVPLEKHMKTVTIMKWFCFFGIFLETF